MSSSLIRCRRCRRGRTIRTSPPSPPSRICTRMGEGEWVISAVPQSRVSDSEKWLRIAFINLRVPMQQTPQRQEEEEAWAASALKVKKTIAEDMNIETRKINYRNWINHPRGRRFLVLWVEFKQTPTPLIAKVPERQKSNKCACSLYHWLNRAESNHSISYLVLELLRFWSVIKSLVPRAQLIGEKPIHLEKLCGSCGSPRF